MTPISFAQEDFSLLWEDEAGLKVGFEIGPGDGHRVGRAGVAGHLVRLKKD
jgi:hypothetical protein